MLPNLGLVSTLRARSHLSRYSRRAFFPSSRSTFSGGRNALTYNLETEWLDRYRPGGYHPVHIGGLLNNGRYRILRKLGFGGNSTVWAARDEILDQNVAVKIKTSETFSTSRELEVLRLCSQSQNESGAEHIPRLLHAFQHDGPNGSHHCLVMDILGPNMAAREYPLDSVRLPREIAKSVIKEVLRGVCYLHKHGLAHGDIHVGNLCFSAPSLAVATEEEFLRILGRPEFIECSGQVGQENGEGIPVYLLWPSPVPAADTSAKNSAKIIGFGQSFTKSTRARMLQTPFALRPPEVFLDDDWDYRVDLWSTGCTIFELMTGVTPFHNITMTKETTVKHMIKSRGELPPMWQDKLLPHYAQFDGLSIQGWLQRLNLDLDCPIEYTPEELEGVSSLIGQLMRFNPCERISAEDAYWKWNTLFPQ